MTLVQLPKSKSEIRDYIVNEIKNNIVGPRSNDEEINFNPKNEYFSGILFPNDWELDDEDKEFDGGDSEENDSGTSEISKDKLYKQSSFGLTCLLKKETKKINAKVSFGIYNTSEQQYHYKRTHYDENFIIDTTINQNTQNFKTDSKFYIQYNIRKKFDSVLLDLYVINGHKVNNKKDSINQLMFQPQITLSSSDPDYCFVEDHKEIADSIESKEDKHMN